MRLAIASALMLAVATPAFAQREVTTGTRVPVARPAEISDRGGLPEAVRGRMALEQFARCTVEEGQERVRRALALPVKERSKELDRLATGFCLRAGGIKMSASLLRGALYAELYRRAYGAADPGLVEARIEFDGEIGLLQYADCVARGDPLAARRVVLANVASSAEDGAFASLTPHFGPCLPQGQEITFSKAVLKGALAEVLYREAKAPPAGVGKN